MDRPVVILCLMVCVRFCFCFCVGVVGVDVGLGVGIRWGLGVDIGVSVQLEFQIIHRMHKFMHHHRRDQRSVVRQGLFGKDYRCPKLCACEPCVVVRIGTLKRRGDYEVYSVYILARVSRVGPQRSVFMVRGLGLGDMDMKWRDWTHPDH